jgi:peptidase MA superfamily protein
MRAAAFLGLLATQVVGLAMPETLDGVPYLSIEGRRVRVFFSPRDSLVARRVRSLLDDQPRLPGLPEGVPTGVQVVLAHSSVAFDEITGGTVPEWRAGVAMPASNTLVMPTGEGVSVVAGEGLRTLRHEWAHLGLSADLGDLRIPRWFNEGYAQWASGGFDVAGAWRLRVLIAAGRAPAMDSLELRWPAGRQEARTAYLLAASAVTYLLETGGERGLRLFLDRWKAQRSFETAFRDTFGLTVSQFEEDWGRHVKDRYGWLFLMSHSSVFWLVLALVLLFMVRGRQAYDRQRLAKLRASEIPDAPAYWDERASHEDRAPGEDRGSHEDRDAEGHGDRGTL